jgi:hypothetical protein
LSLVYVHSFYEWLFVTFQAQYIFAAVTGLIAGLAQQLGYFSVGARQQALSRQDFEAPPNRAWPYFGKRP